MGSPSEFLLAETRRGCPCGAQDKGGYIVLNTCALRREIDCKISSKRRQIAGILESISKKAHFEAGMGAELRRSYGNGAAGSG